jgi:subtilisin family serine protease
MDKRLSIIVLLLLFFSLALKPGHAQQPTVEAIPGELLVKFQPQQKGQLHLIAGATLLESAPQGGWLRLRVEPGQEAAMLAQLRQRGDVKLATYNYQIEAIGAPSDADFGQQWNLNNTGQTGGNPDADIDAPEAWNIFSGDSNITLAVIDTGVDLDHPDLQANLVPGYDFYNDDAIPDDDNSHGTHAAGIAAAIGNNGVGISGVSWAAKIMSLKILNAQGNGSLFDLVQALYYATDHGAKVVNMSLGGSCSGIDWSSVEEAVAYAVSKGVLLVAASGNINAPAPLCPAGLAGVLAVGATDNFDLRWSGSNYGSTLDVTAPGASIYSTVHEGNYGYKTGTSMAGPHVAGLAALVWSLDPTLTSEQVSDAILSNSDDLGAPGWDQYFGYGRINAWRAVDAVSFQVPREHTILLGQDTLSVTDTLQLVAVHPQAITWTTTISPVASWLSLSPPSSGTISATSSPASLSFVATQPATSGVYTATLITTGTLTSGATLLPRQTEVRLTYGALHRMIFPFIVNR